MPCSAAFAQPPDCGHIKHVVKCKMAVLNFQDKYGKLLMCSNIWGDYGTVYHALRKVFWCKYE